MAINRGISYPLTIAAGNLATSIDVDLIKEQIFSWLETNYRERVMRPVYGMRDMIFSPIIPGTIAAYVETGLNQNITDTNFIVGADVYQSGEVALEIRWSYRGQLQPPIEYQLKV